MHRNTSSFSARSIPEKNMDIGSTIERCVVPELKHSENVLSTSLY